MRSLTVLTTGLWLSGCSTKTGSDDREPLGPAETHEWTEYRHEDRVDDVACSGQGSDSAVIEGVFFAQTHFMSPDWPFFFLVADRPALAEVRVTGSGSAPEVSITATVDGETQGTLCIGGPETLAASVDATVHARDDRFTVTLPAEWLQPGLALEVQAGSDSVT